MNNKLKRALSSILAFVMICSCVLVMNVSNVFAAGNYGIYDFGFAEGSLISEATYTEWGIPNGSNQAAGGTYTVGDLTFVSSDGKARIYWSKSVDILGTTYTGYFNTNGTRAKGDTGRMLQIDVNAGDVITVVSSTASYSGEYGLEIYNTADTSIGYDNAALEGSGSITEYMAPTAGIYNINVYGAKSYIYRVTVEKSAEYMPQYIVNGAALTEGTVTVNGTEYSVTEGIPLSEGTVCNVVYTDGEKTYKGTFTADASNTTPSVALTEVEVTNISLDFMNGNIITSADGNNTFYITKGVASTTVAEDYDVKIGTVKTHNSGYGVVGNNFTIELKDVVAPAVINLGMNDYGGVFSLSSTDAAAEYADADGIVNTTFNTKGGKYASDPANVKTIYYTGTEQATITLTASGQIYLPYISVNTIEKSEIPELVYGNTGVQITAAGAEDGDIVILTDSSKNQFDTTIANGVADFTGDVIMVGEAQIEVLGYTVTGSPVTITSDVTAYEVTATLNGSAVPAGSDTANLYVGYTPTTGYNVYKTVQSAVDAAVAGDKIVIADGSYHELTGVTVDTDNITIESASGDKTKVIIWDNDNEQAAGAKGFHGDTLLVNANGFVANNITIMNNAEETGMIPNTSSSSNATALGINSKDKASSASATFNNCSILATRDTIYTGSKNPTALTLNNCLITGFQDTICGSGTVILNDCTMNPELGVLGTKFTTSKARLLCPRNYGSNDGYYVANNLTIAAMDGTSANPIYFARSWDGSQSAVIINGYNIDSSAKTRFDAALADNYYGFSPTGISSSVNTNTLFWLARQTEDTGVYNTTLKTLNETAANLFQSATKEIEDDGTVVYRIVGKLNSALVSDEYVQKAGFAVYNADGSLKGIMSDSVVYSEDNANYYTVNFATNVDTAVSLTLKPYVKYNTFDVVSNASEALTYAE